MRRSWVYGVVLVADFGLLAVYIVLVLRTIRSAVVLETDPLWAPTFIVVFLAALHRVSSTYGLRWLRRRLLRGLRGSSPVSAV